MTATRPLSTTLEYPYSFSVNGKYSGSWYSLFSGKKLKGQRQHKTTVPVYFVLVLAKYIYENPVCLNSHWRIYINLGWRTHFWGHSTYLGNKYGFGIFVQLTWLILKSLGKNRKAELKYVKWQINSCKWQLVHPSCHNCTGSISKELAFQANNSNLVKWIMWTDLL